MRTDTNKGMRYRLDVRESLREYSSTYCRVCVFVCASAHACVCASAHHRLPWAALDVFFKHTKMYTLVGPGSPGEQHKWFSAICVNFWPIFTCFVGPFHQSLGMVCQKELEERLFKQGHWFSTIRYILVTATGHVHISVAGFKNTSFHPRCDSEDIWHHYTKLYHMFSNL